MADATGVAVMGFVALHVTQTAYNAIIMAATTRTDGAIDEIRLDKMAAQVVTELHGKYNEQAYRGNVFTATMTSGVFSPAPVSTASNPIALANGAGRGRRDRALRDDHRRHDDAHVHNVDLAAEHYDDLGALCAG